jgi:hypothetical protein
MENNEFLYHLQMIKKLGQNSHVRIILLHPPYTEKQQKTIDFICRRSNQIIGQIERTPPLKDTAEEIGRIISSHKEPFISPDQLQYVILGKVTKKD